jgi:hypothetical protein
MLAGREAAAGKVSGGMTAILPGSSTEVAGAYKGGLSRRLQLCLICRAHCPANQCLNRLPFSLCSRGGRQAS